MYIVETDNNATTLLLREFVLILKRSIDTGLLFRNLRFVSLSSEQRISSSANINSRTGDTCLRGGDILGIIIFAVQQYLFSKPSSLFLETIDKSWRNQGERTRAYKSIGRRIKLAENIWFSKQRKRFSRY